MERNKIGAKRFYGFIYNSDYPNHNLIMCLILITNIGKLNYYDHEN